ncbi:MAG: nicotinate-nucleotide--dimethylbenzimidazole phosphoribosyltransferase [Mogibacterium sp.]|nr:nicotinate-nucleotide--dimethylbenzimidazole phosphoribosyltransferase [Mogibacterium sp.]
MINIVPFDKDKYDEIRTRWDSIAKPLNSLGRFEEITARIGAIQGSAEIDIKKRAVIIMCADNGIIAEGVSQSGQDVTRAVAEWMGRGESSVCRMAREAKADIIPVDVGINMEGSPKGVIDRKVMKGTRNFAHEPAMTEDECMQAIEAGIDIVCDCSAGGYRFLATGEMGIGNTTTSSALAAALLGLDADIVTGRGAGLSTEGLRKKTEVIKAALDKYDPADDEGRTSPEYAMHMLSCVGGLDIAGLSGVFIGGAMNHIPVIIDGFISAVAALVAERLVPGTRNFMIASHIGKEPGMKYILDILGLEPVIDGKLALGEGTGAVMLMPLLDTALALYSNGLSFADTTVEQYHAFEEESAGGTAVLVIGSPDSGKSAMAEKTVTELSDPDHRIYLATMIPYGIEGRERVERHRRMREGKGFITIESPFDIRSSLSDYCTSNGIRLGDMTVLLECLSNLVANELFERRSVRDEMLDRLYEDVRWIAQRSGNLVIVSNHFEIEGSFDEETRFYAETLDMLNEMVSGLADKTIRI